MEVPEEMGMDVEDTCTGEVKCVDVWEIFKVVVQEVILFDSETWLVTPYIGRTMRGFQHRVDCRLNGKQPRLLPDSRWEYLHPLPTHPLGHRRELHVLHYPRIMVIYPYTLFGVICMVTLHVFII